MSLASRQRKLRIARARLRRDMKRLDLARKHNVHPRGWLVRLVGREAALVTRRKVEVHEAKVAAATLADRAYAEASRLVGVMEQGGNNVGTGVERIIKEGGGLRGQAWCGWFCAAVYKRAGSKAVDWHWGAVRLIPDAVGVARTSSPRRGDLVRYNFDHVGMFVKDNGDGTITTIEGNTGASGAVSDSKTGGDGVYRKVRSKGLVRDYLRITR